MLIYLFVEIWQDYSVTSAFRQIFSNIYQIIGNLDNKKDSSLTNSEFVCCPNLLELDIKHKYLSFKTIFKKCQVN